MGQGLTGGPSTYSRLKDIVTGPIPQPHTEPALANVDPKRIVSRHFVDDNVGGYTNFDTLYEFLHTHYFPRLAWARLTLNPKKTFFFTDEVTCLGFRKTPGGLLPSLDKWAAFRDIKSQQSEEELKRFV